MHWVSSWLQQAAAAPAGGSWLASCSRSAQSAERKGRMVTHSSGQVSEFSATKACSWLATCRPDACIMCTSGWRAVLECTSGWNPFVVRHLWLELHGGSAPRSTSSPCFGRTPAYKLAGNAQGTERQRRSPAAAVLGGHRRASCCRQCTRHRSRKADQITNGRCFGQTVT